MRKIILFLVLTLLTKTSFAQSSKGKDFWVMFNNSYQTTTRILYIYISSTVNTSGLIEIPGISFSQNFTVSAGSLTTVIVPVNAEVTTSDIIETKAIHITALNDVVIYGLNGAAASSDAFLAIPTNSLGKNHFVITYRTDLNSYSSEFGIVASDDNTLIKITPSQNATNHLAGVEYSIVLNKNQCYQLKSSFTSGIQSDLTGSKIVSNKPVSVFGGHVCANIPPLITYCNHIIEQLPSVDFWGKEFITSSLAYRTNGDIFRVLASKNGTVVRLDGNIVSNLNEGQFFEVDLSSNSFHIISTTEPCLVAQYCKGGTSDGRPDADPFMVIIPSKEQYFGSTIFEAPTSNPIFNVNFVNIITPDAGVGVIKLDGNFIPSSSFSSIGASGFSGARVLISSGTHSLYAPNIPFASLVYGFGAPYDSYGYLAGQNYIPLATQINVDNPTKLSFCAGNGLEIAFIPNGIFNSNNNFQVQLSNPIGNFDYPIILRNSISSGVLSCTIPQNTLEGNGYKIRVVSSDPYLVSNLSNNLNIAPKELILQSPTDNISTTINKKAVDKIIATNKLLQPAVVNYSAGSSIELNAGFNAELGTFFIGKISSCEN